MVATETVDDDGEALSVEEISALKPLISSSKDLILPTIPDEDFSRRSGILKVAWLCLLVTEQCFEEQNSQRDHLESNLHTSCAIGYSSLQCSPVGTPVLRIHQTYHAGPFASRFLDRLREFLYEIEAILESDTNCIKDMVSFTDHRSDVLGVQSLFDMIDDCFESCQIVQQVLQHLVIVSRIVYEGNQAF
jgi:hypothetical protein